MGARDLSKDGPDRDAVRRFWEGCRSVKETAERFSMPLGTVKRWMTTGKWVSLAKKKGDTGSDTDTQKGDTDTQKGDTDTQKGDTDTQKGDTDTGSDTEKGDTDTQGDTRKGDTDTQGDTGKKSEKYGSVPAPDMKVLGIFRALVPTMDAAGLPVPLEMDEVPLLNLKMPPDDIAQWLGELLRTKGFFVWAGNVVTVSPAGEIKFVEPVQFVTDIAEFCIPFERRDKDSDAPLKGGMSKTLSDIVLNSRKFRSLLPELKAVNRVRLPVFSDEKRLDLLPRGFDASTGIFTVGDCEYDLNIEAEDARTWLSELTAAFPWNDDKGLSFGVWVSCCLSLFCTHLTGGRAPMFLFDANLEGSGKSLLAKIPLYTILGEVGNTTFRSDNATKFDNELDSLAVSGAQAVFFDNLEGWIKSPELDAWLTSPWREGRVFHTQSRFRVSVRAVTVMTGNKIKFSKNDTQRRTLISSLQATERANERELPTGVKPLTDRRLRTPEFRARFLGCLYALVKSWIEDYGSGPSQDGTWNGCVRALSSYEDWSEVVPCIVRTQFGIDPLKPSEAADVGAVEERDFRVLMSEMIRIHCIEKECGAAIVALPEIIKCARENRVFVSMLKETDMILHELSQNKRWEWADSPTGGEPNEDEKFDQAQAYYDQSMGTKFSKRLRDRCLNMTWRAEDGSKWLFEDAKTRKSAFKLHLLP
jgi:hypothetical protein